MLNKKQVEEKIKELLPDYHELFEVDERETLAGNGTTEIRVCMRFGSTFIKRDDIPLDVELSLLVMEFQSFVCPKLREVIDKLVLLKGQRNGEG